MCATYSGPTRRTRPASTRSTADLITAAAAWPRSVSVIVSRRRSSGSGERSRYPRVTRVSTSCPAACLDTPSSLMIWLSGAPLRAMAPIT